MRLVLRSAPRSLALIVLFAVPFIVPGRALADWPQFGRAICEAPASQVHPAIASDGADGAIIAWQDSRNARGNIFARRVKASGEPDPAWPVDGQALLGDLPALAGTPGGQATPQIVVDGAGGAIVAWIENRSAVTETDIFAQHVLASGALDPAWPANGTAVVAFAGLQNTFAMIPDGAGGAFVTWMDTRLGAGMADLYAQHVLPSGTTDPRWPVSGLAVSTTAGQEEFPAILSDGAGGAIIAWDMPGGASGFDIFAQHVLGSGVIDPAWPAGGRAVCAAGGNQGRPTLAADGAHGAIVAWTDSRLVNTVHIFAQHLLASGAVDPTWIANGREISGAADLESRPLAVSDGAGGSVVTWQGFTVILNIFAQHITAAGVVDPAWPAGGRALSNADRQQSGADIASDGAGGAIVAWQDGFDLVAHHVLSSGALDPAYPPAGLSVSNLPGAQGDAAIVATGGGGAIVTWVDGSRVTSPDVFAMQVLEVSTVDVPPPAAPGLSFARPARNPARGPLRLTFSLPREERVRLAIYDMTGRLVRVLASGFQPSGQHEVEWDLRDDGGRPVGAGLFFARLEADGEALTQKIAALN